MSSLPGQSARQPKCPVCGRVFVAEQAIALPFCSPRCRQIDLGRWLNEEIGMPVEPSDDEEWEYAADDPSSND